MKKFSILFAMLFVPNVNAGGMPVIDAALIGVANAQGSAIVSAIAAVEAAVVAMDVNLGELLFQVGSAITQGTDKVVTAIGADGDATRGFLVNQGASSKMYQAKVSYSIPENICADSASGSAVSIQNATSSFKSSTRAGGGAKITNTQINNYVNTPPLMGELDSAINAKIHSTYCDQDDFDAYGGSEACPQVSGSMPGADKRIDTLYIGAGPNNKSVDLTFTQEQIDASYMFIQNAGKRSISPALKKGEADSVAGAQYIGYTNQYNAVRSVALDPLEQYLAAGMPSEVATEALNEALAAPSAAYYWENFGSENAKKLGKISSREFEQFEVGRKYANSYYAKDIQEMTTENLLREQIRAINLNNWLLANMKNEIMKNNIISGLSLASQARSEYSPILNGQYQNVTKSMGTK